MAKVTSRIELIEYCLRRLGFPVIEINVDEDQVDDRIDDALEFYADYHFDGTQKTYLAVELTQTDIDNGYISAPESMLFISNALPLSTGTSTSGVPYPFGDPNACIRS